MIWFLRILFISVLGSMLWVTSWASLQVSLFEIPREVGAHPWFIATLFDAYWGFITFYVWLAYKEPSWPARMLWFLAVVLLGNIAMAIYLLIQLFRVSPDAKLETVVLRSERQVSAWVPAVMIITLGVIAFVA
ncbi:DUF1475 family protein [Oleiharenicola lentus]|uniref:DUF1475 family protein n=1 Tax=Oleiharenicola lentus TaxID=2508720 RepID=UPI003F67DD3B